MEAISFNAVQSGAYLTNSKPLDVEKKQASNISVNTNSTQLNKTNDKEPSQDPRDAADTAMKDIQHFISSQARSVRISKDANSGHIIVQLIDPGTGEVIRTLPSEELLRLARSFEMLGNKMVAQMA